MTCHTFSEKPILSVAEIHRAEQIALPPYLLSKIEREQVQLKQQAKAHQKALLKQIEIAGFECFGCGRCCERAEAENAVYVLPAEIDNIEDYIGCSRNEFILPLLPDYFEEKPGTGSQNLANLERLEHVLESLADQTDADGCLHTFGWMLQRNNDGSCLFLDSATKKCRIYEVRPSLCRTYPFYLEADGLVECECGGLGKKPLTHFQLAADLSEALCLRAAADHRDYALTEALLREKQGELHFGGAGGCRDLSLKNNLLCMVYDGTGIYKVQIEVNRPE